MNREFEKILKVFWERPVGMLNQGTIRSLQRSLESRTVRFASQLPRERSNCEVKEQLARRVYVRGEWHFWIKCCDWKVCYQGKLVEDSSTVVRIRRAADFPDGQKLIRFSILARKDQSIFVFDLGASLKIFPYDKSSEQWMLFEPSEKVLVLRADGQHKYIRSRTSADEGTWRPIQIIARHDVKARPQLSDAGHVAGSFDDSVRQN